MGSIPGMILDDEVEIGVTPADVEAAPAAEDDPDPDPAWSTDPLRAPCVDDDSFDAEPCPDPDRLGACGFEDTAALVPGPDPVPALALADEAVVLFDFCLPGAFVDRCC